MGIGSSELCDNEITGVHPLGMGRLKGRESWGSKGDILLLKNMLSGHIFTCMLEQLQNREKY